MNRLFANLRVFVCARVCDPTLVLKRVRKREMDDKKTAHSTGGSPNGFARLKRHNSVPLPLSIEVSRGTGLYRARTRRATLAQQNTTNSCNTNADPLLLDESPHPLSSSSPLPSTESSGGTVSPCSGSPRSRISLITKPVVVSWVETRLGPTEVKRPVQSGNAS